MMWETLNKANQLAELRPVPADIIEQLQALAEKVSDPLEKAMIENIKVSYVLFKKEHGNFNGY